MFKTLAVLTMLMLTLTACGGPTSTPAPAAPAADNLAVKTIEQYLQAKITGDEKTLRSLLCSFMEQNLQVEATTFLGTSGVKIEGMACAADGPDKVTCQGKIVADYGQEKNEFPLGSYNVVQEDGEWKYCGEAQ